MNKAHGRLSLSERTMTQRCSRGDWKRVRERKTRTGNRGIRNKCVIRSPAKLGQWKRHGRRKKERINASERERGGRSARVCGTPRCKREKNNVSDSRMRDRQLLSASSTRAQSAIINLGYTRRWRELESTEREGEKERERETERDIGRISGDDGRLKHSAAITSAADEIVSFPFT